MSRQLPPSTEATLHPGWLESSCECLPRALRWPGSKVPSAGVQIAGWRGQIRADHIGFVGPDGLASKVPVVWLVHSR